MRLSFFLLGMLVATGCGTGHVNPAHRVVGNGIFPPAITMLSPSTTPVGSPSFYMSVVGNNFGPDTVLYWNGTPTNTILVNSKELMAQITDTDLQIVGLVPVFVRTGGLNSNTIDFEVSIQ